MTHEEAAVYVWETYEWCMRECENAWADKGMMSKTKEAFDLALAALRDVQARQKGCKYCAINDWERKPLATFNTYFNNYEEEQHEIGIDDYEGGYRIASTLGNNGPSVDIRFCPNCGRNLTEKETQE